LRRLCHIWFSAGISILGSFSVLVAQSSDASGAETGISSGNAAIVDWAVSCLLERGPGIILFPDSVEVTTGEASYATGPAGDKVVSLGDGGMAILSFEHPIMDGPGPDFAVFENSFDGYFLELGFVEVSSDGETFHRFPASSLTPVDSQIGPFDILDPENIHNLAGKFRSGWGTPFDLAELSEIPGLNTDHITAVRIIDVIGILDDSLGSRDAGGRLINDPFPTPFENGGFDLDAVGVIHTSETTGMVKTGQGTEPAMVLFPNPFRHELYVEFPEGFCGVWMLRDLNGRILRKGHIHPGQERKDLGELPAGIYIMQGVSKESRMQKRLIKY
jgi:hypothetical protein